MTGTLRQRLGVPLLLGLVGLLGPGAFGESDSAPSAWRPDQAYPAGATVRYHQATWRAATNAPPGHAPLGVGDGLAADRDLLLERRAGFGHLVTGGRAGPTHSVTTAADDGPGSLREALARPGPLWIVFGTDMTITVRSGLLVSSDKTIDGRSRHVLLTGHNQPGLIVDGATNIIVENLFLRDFGDTDRTQFNDTPDAILLQNGARTVWIDHCSLSKAGDKLIAVNGGSTEVTVSWNRFFEQQQVFQVSCQATQDQDTNTCVTSHHNFFDRTGYRNPVVSYGKVHAYNNYLREWRNYGMRAERTGQLYSEANVLEPGENRAAVRSDTPGTGWNDGHTRYDKRPGLVKSVGDWKLNRAQVKTRDPEKVFDPHHFYPYQVDLANGALKALVAGHAGPQVGLWQLSNDSEQPSTQKQP